MGYTTEFTGRFNLSQKLAPAHSRYLRAFAESRRMQRDADRAASLPDSRRHAVGLPVGEEGGFFVGSVDDGNFEQGLRDSPDSSIIDYNTPPLGQPNLWCQWVPTEDGLGLEWDGGEKFYDYVQWLQYIVHHFLTPWGYRLNGEVEWQGEGSGDFGKLVVVNNQVRVMIGKKVYE